MAELLTGRPMFQGPCTLSKTQMCEADDLCDL